MITATKKITASNLTSSYPIHKEKIVLDNNVAADNAVDGHAENYLNANEAKALADRLTAAHDIRLFHTHNVLATTGTTYSGEFIDERNQANANDVINVAQVTRPILDAAEIKPIVREGIIVGYAASIAKGLPRQQSRPLYSADIAEAKALNEEIKFDNRFNQRIGKMTRDASWYIVDFASRLTCITADNANLRADVSKILFNYTAKDSLQKAYTDAKPFLSRDQVATAMASCIVTNIKGNINVQLCSVGECMPIMIDPVTLEVIEQLPVVKNGDNHFQADDSIQSYTFEEDNLLKFEMENAQTDFLKDYDKYEQQFTNVVKCSLDRFVNAWREQNHETSTIAIDSKQNNTVDKNAAKQKFLTNWNRRKSKFPDIDPEQIKHLPNDVKKALNNFLNEWLEDTQNNHTVMPERKQNFPGELKEVKLHTFSSPSDNKHIPSSNLREFKQHFSIEAKDEKKITWIQPSKSKQTAPTNPLENLQCFPGEVNIALYEFLNKFKNKSHGLGDAASIAKRDFLKNWRENNRDTPCQTLSKSFKIEACRVAEQQPMIFLLSAGAYKSLFSYTSKQFKDNQDSYDAKVKSSTCSIDSDALKKALLAKLGNAENRPHSTYAITRALDEIVLENLAAKRKEDFTDREKSELKDRVSGEDCTIAAVTIPDYRVELVRAWLENPPLRAKLLSKINDEFGFNDLVDARTKYEDRKKNDFSKNKNNSTTRRSSLPHFLNNWFTNANVKVGFYDIDRAFRLLGQERCYAVNETELANGIAYQHAPTQTVYSKKLLKFLNKELKVQLIKLRNTPPPPEEKPGYTPPANNAVAVIPDKQETLYNEIEDIQAKLLALPQASITSDALQANNAYKTLFPAAEYNKLLAKTKALKKIKAKSTSTNSALMQEEVLMSTNDATLTGIKDNLNAEQQALTNCFQSIDKARDSMQSIELAYQEFQNRYPDSKYKTLMPKLLTFARHHYWLCQKNERNPAINYIKQIHAELLANPKNRKVNTSVLLNPHYINLINLVAEDLLKEHKGNQESRNRLHYDTLTLARDLLENPINPKKMYQCQLHLQKIAPLHTKIANSFMSIIFGAVLIAGLSESINLVGGWANPYFNHVFAHSLEHFALASFASALTSSTLILCSLYICYRAAHSGHGIYNELETFLYNNLISSERMAAENKLTQNSFAYTEAATVLPNQQTAPSVGSNQVKSNSTDSNPNGTQVSTTIHRPKALKVN